MVTRRKTLFTILSVLILLLVVVNILIGLGNQSLQADLGERQQEIAQTMQLGELNRQLINVLANLALKNNDEQLKQVLASAGINLGPAKESAPAKESTPAKETAPVKK